MKRGTWCTKEDVLKDLEVASGQKVTDVDDTCFVVGEGPPPPRLFNDEDDEIELLYGRKASREQLIQKKEAGPDLTGITKMLRMVQEYEHSSGEEDIITDVGSKRNVIVISKLNPNVKEFVPKTLSSQNGITTNTITITNEKASSANITDSSTNKFENAVPIVKTETVAVTTKNEANSKEVKRQMATMLKNKISAKSDTFEEKRQANLAIVNLLKLYSKPEPKMARTKTLKLYTPEFFENCKASDFKTDTEDTSNKTDCSIEQMTSLPSEDVVKKVGLPLVQPRHYDSNVIKENKVKFHSTILSKDDKEYEELNKETSLTPDMADNSIDDHFTIPSVAVDKPDPYVAESINKVNNWLDNKPYVKKEKPKSPALYLGTVCYKRKDPVTCKSPSEVADKKILKPSDATYKPSDTAYKPSSYADELHKKYKERSKEKMATTRPLNIWEKLEEDLKRKDKEIKKRNKKDKPMSGSE